MNNALFVGIDVSSKNNVAYIMKPDGDKHSLFSIPNNRPGAEILVDRIVEVLRRLLLPNMPVLHGHSTSQASLRRKIPALLATAITTYATIFAKPPIL